MHSIRLDQLSQGTLRQPRNFLPLAQATQSIGDLEVTKVLKTTFECNISKCGNIFIRQ